MGFKSTLTQRLSFNSSVSALITTTPIAAGSKNSDTIFTSQTPATSTATPGEYGVKFQARKKGYVIGIRYYKNASETGSHTGRIWTSTGTQIGSVAFTGETASGWQTQYLSAPVFLDINADYIVSVEANARASFTTAGLSATVSNGMLYTTGGSANTTTIGAFPTSTTTNNYFRDVIFAY